MEASRCAYKRSIKLNSVRQHNYFITQGKLNRLHVSTIDQSSSGLFLSFESQDAMHTLGSHRVYSHGIRKIKSFVSKGVTCKLQHTIETGSEHYQTILSTILQDNFIMRDHMITRPLLRSSNNRCTPTSPVNVQYTIAPKTTRR